MQAVLLLAAVLVAGVDCFGFVTAVNGSFFEDGLPARYAGTNALSLAQFGDAFARRDVLSRMARANMTLLRLWAFSDGESCGPAPPRQNFFQCWDAATKRVLMNETGLALHLDGALADAFSAGIHVILSLVNNWPAYGGYAAYAQWREAAAAAGVAPPLDGPVHHDDFYVDETMRAWYRAWVSALIGRVNSQTGVAYRDDPTIFAWELGNELACTNSSAGAPCVAANGTSPSMRAWVAEMSALIKEGDSRHMVAVGDEGFYGGDDTGEVPCPAGGPPSGKQWWCDGSAGDWLGLLRTSGIDFGSLHMYPDSFEMRDWGLGDEDDVARGWIVNHTREAHALGKPVLLGEFGHGSAQLAQSGKYANYTRAAAEAGTDGWAVWMMAGLDDTDFYPPNWPSWWRGGDANLQVYCAQPGDPVPPEDGGAHDPETCTVLAKAARELHGARVGVDGGGAVSAVSAGSAHSGGDVRSFLFSADPVARHVPSDFVSFSIETQSAPPMLLERGALSPTPSARRSFATLMRFLRAQSPGMRGPNIRVGGSSADATIYAPTAGAPLPENITYEVTDLDLAGYAAAAAVWAGSVTVDVNLGRALPCGFLNASAAHAAAAVRILGPLLDGVECGNEPDGWHSWGGPLRPSNYSFADFYDDLDAALREFGGAGVNARGLIQGATYCCAETTWGADLPAFVRRFAPSLRSVSYHRYPDVNNATTSVRALLSDACAEGAAATVAPFAAAARAGGVPFFIGEGNSVNGGGLPNISDTWAAALWATDVLFSVAAVGAQRWNFHGGPQGWYAPIRYATPAAQVAPPTVMPLWYGLAAFAAATANASDVFSTVGVGGSSLVKAWGARDGVTAQWRCVVIHKDMDAAGAVGAGTRSVVAASTLVVLAPPNATAWPASRGAAPTLMLRRVAPASGSAFAKDGISFGGITWDGTVDGEPSGTQVVEVVAPSDGGAGGASPFTYAYRFNVTPLSIVLGEWGQDV